MNSNINRNLNTITMLYCTVTMIGILAGIESIIVVVLLEVLVSLIVIPTIILVWVSNTRCSGVVIVNMNCI